MSRIGKLPIQVSKDISVNINNTLLTLKKGNKTKEYDFGDKVDVKFEDDHIVVSIEKEEFRNFWGLHRNNISNLVIGLTTGFKKILEFNGVGYKAIVNNNFLVLTLGYSHDIAYSIPEGIKITIEKNTIIIEGDNKELVGRVGSTIIGFRKTEPYKGKGVKELGQYIVRKEGKKK